MYRVTCAVIRNDNGEILVVQRGGKSDHPGKWEFPGGKVEKGEADEDCVLREIREELGIDMVICNRLPEVEHDYGFKKITLVPFVCDTLDTKPILTEHSSYNWLDPNDLMEVDFCEADIPVALNYTNTLNPKKTKIRGKRPKTDSQNDDTDSFDQLVEKMKHNEQIEWVARSATEDPKILNQLLKLSLLPDRRMAFHASWALGKAFDTNRELIKPHINMLVNNLFTLSNESVLRIFLRTIALCEMVEVDEGQRAKLADYCFGLLKSADSAVAIKVHSMEILYNLTLLYPEFANELVASIGVVLNGSSGAILAHGRMILKKMDQL